ncbi:MULTISPECIES: 2OG-Fe dioxygenase family protein [Thermomonas]|uniref:2OG-Fe dioxygenase family protein n=1 Tax=Thermomonas beijingensis TaxID=2872701 RepID=A0ABS7TEW8_9GAMM|nr:MULTISPECIES: 2OG-Fe dioxygenase family protein [Thermomonas]MBS0460058.1 2OG-Fe dioxygenase family protein [Pseudomonadota bacterium]MBZ4186388.1 2OG-Fe dioxygenase family protein [Thermomonas beijingensis]HOC11848.1 2OG-Fe dioxygenase family protein [Thermomonas sp.]HQE08533.1 2OG-Fe dioxygenase family protein [Thermomonas sp.]
MSPVTAFAPPAIALPDLDRVLHQRGYVVLAAADVAALAGVPLSALQALEPSWESLCLDRYLKDGGRYRKRRHACFIAEDDQLQQVPHRMHWQPVEYNALHGGMERWFEPVLPETVRQAAWSALILALARVCSAQRPVPRWHVEAHQFRIDTSDGVGRPTPEGAHRDGVDFVAVLLVARHAIKGGETRVFDAHGPNGQRFTLDQPWSLLLMDDARVIHESTPIQPLHGVAGHRDTLVLTLRAAGFLGG